MRLVSRTWHICPLRCEQWLIAELQVSGLSTAGQSSQCVCVNSPISTLIGWNRAPVCLWQEKGKLLHAILSLSTLQHHHTTHANWVQRAFVGMTVHYRVVFNMTNGTNRYVAYLCVLVYLRAPPPVTFSTPLSPHTSLPLSARRQTPLFADRLLPALLKQTQQSLTGIWLSQFSYDPFW